MACAVHFACYAALPHSTQSVPLTRLSCKALETARTVLRRRDAEQPVRGVMESRNCASGALHSPGIHLRDGGFHRRAVGVEAGGEGDRPPFSVPSAMAVPTPVLGM